MECGDDIKGGWGDKRGRKDDNGRAGMTNGGAGVTNGGAG